MDNIWFYTLSTSAQVLAALAGLFAVFVVWRIQGFDKILLDTRNEIITRLDSLVGNTQGYKRVPIENLYLMPDLEILTEFSKLISYIDKLPADQVGTPINTLDRLKKITYQNYIDKKLNILKSLQNILFVNILVIAVCIFVLTFSSIITSKFNILRFVSCLVFCCLYLIGEAIYKITEK